MVYTVDYASNFLKRQDLHESLRVFLTSLYFSFQWLCLCCWYSVPLLAYYLLSNTATHFRGFFLPPLRDTTRKIMVKSETRGWRWNSFEGSQIFARKRGGVVAINYLDFSKEFGANRGHQWRSVRALPIEVSKPLPISWVLDTGEAELTTIPFAFSLGRPPALGLFPQLLPYMLNKPSLLPRPEDPAWLGPACCSNNETNWRLSSAHCKLGIALHAD